MQVKDIFRLYSNMGCPLKDSPRVVLQTVSFEEPSDKDSKDRVLMEIFANDPLTNKPMNDLVLSANQRLDPVVRDFIKQNLQAPVEPQKAPADYGLCDDLCRKSDETVFEYQQRLRQMSVDGIEYVKSASQKVAKSKKS